MPFRGITETLSDVESVRVVHSALDKHFPGMKDKYIRQYGNAYELPSPNAKELRELFQNICRENGILSIPKDCFEYLQDFPDKYIQMSLFDL